jgi:type II secretory pathway pseudopilin PulG
MVKPLAIAAAVAVATLGLAAWAVPNFLEAMNRSHQNRSLANLRAISTAWEARATEMKTYAIGAKSRDPIDDTKVSWNALTPVSTPSLQRVLQPTYIRVMPTVDGWGHPFEFAAGDQTYAIRSRGRDGRPDSANPTYVMARTKSFDADAVLINGSFLRGPEGL